jgi:uncharacterized HAD superfamily protein
MQLIIDLDGTICTEEKTFSRAMAIPLPGAIDSVNMLYDEGHTIIIYSARSWPEYEMTHHWLQKHDVKFHQLIMGKPVGDAWIDDRAIAFKSWEETIKVLESKRKK